MTRSAVALALAFLVLVPAAAAAKPAHKQALAGHMGPFLVARANDCRLCHVPGDTGPDADKPRNPFGERLEEVRGELKAAGKSFDVAARFDAVATEDADGDGASNLIEVLTGHFPGDPKDAPTAGEIRAAERTVEKYKRFLASYPWRPFEPVARPAVPKAGEGWAANPIDAFIAEGHREHDLTPRPDAGRAVLLRRVYFDLIGLPPTPTQVRAFEQDTSKGAYEKVVDELLASPRYGERWGRHWMDVWRYSDWAGWSGGNDVRDSQPHVWRWRDWIVESLNADTGYDRMVHEMLAGDEIAPTDPRVLRATGYLARNFKASREKWMTDVVDHTFLAFQGLTIGCARCHDHLYDPIKQTEYYRVRAVFEPHKIRLDPVGGEKDTKKDGLARAFDADPKAVTYLYRRGDERNPDTSQPVVPGVPGFLKVPFPEVKAITGTAGASTGRRLALAHWLTDAKNPLTARVAVNHIWMRHFGQPLVPSVFDFGTNGRRPALPALLDWLAAELVERKWSMKHLHRLILTSRAYRQDSTPDPKSLAADRDNLFFWRVPPRRLEAEAVRDQLLCVAGKLDLATGGPDLDHNSGLTVYRRSLYFRHAHEKQMELLKLFDAAGVSECYQRRESVVPQQALALVNSPLSAEMAKLLTRQLESEVGTDPEKFVTAAFVRVISRVPTAAERAECVTFLADGAADPAGRRRAGVVLSLFNHHEFVTVR
jgi:cytochrome c553